MSKSRSKAAAAKVPQSREEAVSALADYGAVMRELERLETAMNEEIAKIKLAAVAKAEPFRARAEAIEAGLRSFCEANKTALIATAGSKTVNLGVGKVAWRWNPRAVKTSGKMEDILARIKGGGDELAAFLRPSVEIDKVQMLRNPVLAATVEGVEIVDGVETFEIKPDSVKIPEAKVSEAAE